jgi:hypothetical protein
VAVCDRLYAYIDCRIIINNETSKKTETPEINCSVFCEFLPHNVYVSKSSEQTQIYFWHLCCYFCLSLVVLALSNLREPRSLEECETGEGVGICRWLQQNEDAESIDFGIQDTVGSWE